jgi:hypothetical protein
MGISVWAWFVECSFGIGVVPSFRFYFDVSQNADEVLAHTAGSRASAAADTSDLLKTLRKVFEFVHHPLATSRCLIGSGIMARGVLREHGVRTTIPVSATLTGLPVGFVNDIKTVACRAKKTTRSTSKALERDVVPEIALEVLVKPLFNLFVFELYLDFRRCGKLGARRCRFGNVPQFLDELGTLVAADLQKRLAVISEKNKHIAMHCIMW